jgi:DNA-binding PadR family transcriptional regulator
MHSSKRRSSRHGDWEARMTGRHRAGYGHGPRRARRGDVRSAILGLLRERQMHGYEMIQELEARTGGRWRPSAGSIYPTLQLLEDEGLVKAEEVDGKRVFSLTESGTEAAEERSEGRLPWDDGDQDSSYHRLRSEAFRVRAALQQIAQAGDDEQVTRAVDLLVETRKSLYSILAEE